MLLVLNEEAYRKLFKSRKILKCFDLVFRNNMEEVSCNLTKTMKPTKNCKSRKTLKLFDLVIYIYLSIAYQVGGPYCEKLRTSSLFPINIDPNRPVINWVIRRFQIGISSDNVQETIIS